MSGLASLPMYAAPPGALASFWDGIRSRLEAAGFEAPAALREPADLDAHWRDPALVLSQSCGLPVSTVLRNEVEIVGTPHYSAPGCEGATYRSLIVTRADHEAETPDELRGARAAINDFGSHSGSSQLFATVARGLDPKDVFREVVISGAHIRSLELVRTGAADVAAIDCVTYALAARDRPEAVRGLKIVGRSGASPALPFVTAKGWPRRAAALREAIAGALSDPALEEARDALLISGFSTLPSGAYDGFPQAAVTLQGAVLTRRTSGLDLIPARA